MKVDPSFARSSMCASAFGLMFWAFLFFIDFHLTINHIGIDMLPDTVGWLMIATGMKRLIRLAPETQGIRKLAIWAGVLSLVTLFQSQPLQVEQEVDLSSWLTPIALVELVIAILNLICIWKLGGLVVALANELGDSHLARRADFRRKLYVGLILTVPIVTLLALVAPPLAVGLGMCLGILALISFILMMFLMRLTQHACLAAPPLATEFIAESETE